MPTHAITGPLSHVTGPSTNQEYYRKWELPRKRPSVGIAMSGDMYCVMIPGSASLPATARQVGPMGGLQGLQFHACGGRLRLMYASSGPSLGLKFEAYRRMECVFHMWNTYYNIFRLIIE